MNLIDIYVCSAILLSSPPIAGLSYSLRKKILLQIILPDQKIFHIK